MYQKKILDNGLRIVTHDMKGRDSVSLGFWVGVGGRYEEDARKGAAHFVEHILFKGSQKYSCSEIKELIEGVGGTLNAFTSEEQTCYYAKIPSKHLNRTFDILADMVFYPKIASADVNKEKTVIVEEIKMYRDLPQYLVSEHLDALLWPNHPLGKTLAGTPESVTGMSSVDLKYFWGHYYAPGNVVVAACGNIHHDKIVDLVRAKLSKVKSKKVNSFIPVRNDQKVPRLNLFHKKTEQMHVALGTIGFDENNVKRYTLSLMSIILGGNMSSRLFNEVREKRGLAYSISSGSKSMHDTGMFLVRAGVDSQKLVPAVEVILKELDKIRKTGVSLGEFSRAKDYVLGQFQLALEDTMDQMLWFGESEISRGRIVSLEEIIKTISKIKKEDIQTIAKEVLHQKKYNLAVVGPLTETQQKEVKHLIAG